MFIFLDAMLTGGQDRLPMFRIMICLWRHLKLLKRASQFCKAGGAAATAPGELALKCPACPHPGINLPPGWKDASPLLRLVCYCLPSGLLALTMPRFLYTLFTMGDANFCLKNRAHKNGHCDITLGPGMAYAIAPDLLSSHLKNYKSQDEVSPLA